MPTAAATQVETIMTGPHAQRVLDAVTFRQNLPQPAVDADVALWLKNEIKAMVFQVEAEIAANTARSAVVPIPV